MNIGSQVTGKDMGGNNITGTITDVVKTFGVVVVKTGVDRTNVCTAYINDLKESE